MPHALEVAQLRARDQALQAAPLARQQDHVLGPPEQQHRAVELAYLPDGLSASAGVRTVRDWYVTSIDEIVAHPLPSTPESA